MLDTVSLRFLFGILYGGLIIAYVSLLLDIVESSTNSRIVQFSYLILILGSATIIFASGPGLAQGFGITTGLHDLVTVIHGQLLGTALTALLVMAIRRWYTNRYSWQERTIVTSIAVVEVLLLGGLFAAIYFYW